MEDIIASIAQAILDAKQIYEDNYVNGDDENVGRYSKTFDECCKEACEANGIRSNLYKVLSSACSDSQDMQKWAEKVLLELSQNELPCCDSPSKEKCNQC